MEVGASVGEELVLEGGGNVVGSKSRSGMVGVTSGRLVILSSKIRRDALQPGHQHRAQRQMQAD